MKWLLVIMGLMVISSASPGLAQTSPELEASTASTTTVEPKRNPDGAALRSLIFPGWGQHYNGEPTRGYSFLTVAVLGGIFASGLIDLGLIEQDVQEGVGWLLLGGTIAWATSDAYFGAKRVNRENGYDILGRSPLESEQGVELRVAWLRARF